MKHTLGLLTLCGGLLLLLIAGCDEPNEPDLPVRPYHFERTISLEGLSEDVYAIGHWVAVANGSYGAVVFDVSNPSSPQRIYDYVAGPRSFCTNVALDTMHRYLATITDPGDVVNYRVFAFEPGGVQPGLYLDGFGSPISELEVQVSRGPTGDTMIYWATDYSPSSDLFLVSQAYTRPPDSIGWQGDLSCPTYRAPRGRPRGFDIRSDGLLALAMEDGGIVIYNTNTCRASDTLDTPGIAYDCAWAGDYVIVADDYGVTVVDAANPGDIAVIASLDVVGASRLRNVVVDGRYAALADSYDGVYIVDISNPASPQQVQLLSLEDPTAVAALNGRLYVTDRALGLVVYSR